jgi:peptidoglycan/LPS O-acetylase OafA/YrhL
MDAAKVIPFGICWSLAVEEHFYLVWPWLIRRAVANPERLCQIVIAVCVGVLVWRLVARDILLLSTDYTYMATDCRIDSILYGALLRLLLADSSSGANTPGLTGWFRVAQWQLKDASSPWSTGPR